MFACSSDDPAVGQLALCGSADLSEDAGHLQLRWGEGRVFPADTGIPIRELFTYSRHTGPQVTYLALAFSWKGTRYELYDESYHSQSARGLRVTPPGGETADHRCEPLHGSLMTVEGPLPRSEPGA